MIQEIIFSKGVSIRPFTILCIPWSDYMTGTADKGCSFDNAVAESTFEIFKAEFVYWCNFYSLERLRLELGDYINWFNNFRLHGSLGYLSPCEFKAKTL